MKIFTNYLKHRQDDDKENQFPNQNRSPRSESILLMPPNTRRILGESSSMNNGNIKSVSFSISDSPSKKSSASSSTVGYSGVSGSGKPQPRRLTPLEKEVLSSTRPDLVGQVNVNSEKDQAKNMMSLKESIALLDQTLKSLQEEKFSPKRQSKSNVEIGAEFNTSIIKNDEEDVLGFFDWLMNYNPCIEVGAHRTLCSTR